MPAGHRSAILFVVVHFQQITTDHACGDFTQRNDCRLVILWRDHRLVAFGRNLTGTLGGQHDQLEAVINMFKTIFNGYSCHNFPDCICVNWMLHD
jgi:hypothetical protein